MESQAEKLRVLFIDDEPLHLDLLKRILNIIDPMIFIEILSDPTKTIEKILKNYYDCVLVDEKMPIISGNEVVKMIKQLKDIPCIIYTGYDVDEMALNSYKAGADLILQKYLNANNYPELVKTIRDTVKNHNKKEAKCPLEAFFDRLSGLDIDYENKQIVSEGLKTLDEHIRYLTGVRDQVELHFSNYLLAEATVGKK